MVRDLIYSLGAAPTARRRILQPEPAASRTDLVLAEESKHLEPQLRAFTAADPSPVVELLKEILMPLNRRRRHARIVFAASLVFVVILVLIGAAQSGAVTRTSSLRSPSPAAIRYWRSHVIGWARQNAWWGGYLSGRVTFARCGLDRSGGLTTYGCRVVGSIDGTVLAFGGMGRINAGCSYGWTLAPPRSAAHQLTRTFRYCG